MSGGVGGRGLVTPSYPIADYSTMVMVFVSVPTVRVCSPGWSMVSSISTTRQSPPLTARDDFAVADRLHGRNAVVAVVPQQDIRRERHASLGFHNGFIRGHWK